MISVNTGCVSLSIARDAGIDQNGRRSQIGRTAMIGGIYAGKRALAILAVIVGKTSEKNAVLLVA